MPHFAITLRDLIWIGSLLVTVALAYARLKSEIRHVEDTKADRYELNGLSNELRAMLSDIRAAIARLEEAVRSKTWENKIPGKKL